MRRPAILAVDGGGSKIDATLVTRRGELVGAARWIRSTETGGDRAGRDAKGSRLTLDGQGFSPDHDRQRDREQLGAMAAAIDAACTDAGIDPAAGPIADVGVYCLAGADLPSDDRRIARVLRTLGWTGESLVRNDTFAVLRAGSVRGWGVAVVCGYGMNCSAVAPDGRTFRFPALGPLSGDWGGGMDVGSSAVWHAIRAEDGRGGPTSLALSVAEHFGLRRAANVAAAVHLRGPPSRGSGGDGGRGDP